MAEDALGFVFGLIDEFGLRPLLNDEAVREAARGIFSEIEETGTFDDLGRVLDAIPDPIKETAADFWREATPETRGMIREATPDPLEKDIMEYWQGMQDPNRSDFAEGMDFAI